MSRVALDVSKIAQSKEFRQKFVRYNEKRRYHYITKAGWRYLVHQTGSFVGQDMKLLMEPSQQNGSLCVVQCALTFMEGGEPRTYVDIGDASPKTVSSQAARAYVRVAAGRAFNRAAEAALITGPVEALSTNGKAHPPASPADVEDEDPGLAAEDEEFDELEAGVGDEDISDDDEEPEDRREAVIAEIESLIEGGRVSLDEARRLSLSICGHRNPRKVENVERLEALLSQLRRSAGLAKTNGRAG